MKTIIFSDLDGTLLHPETYSFEEARSALEVIRAKGIPLVLCSSKTRAELELCRERLKNTDPFISENGGGIFVPKNCFPFPIGGEVRGDYIVITFGLPYQVIRREFLKLRKDLQVPVKGFGDMSVDQVAALTALPPDEAALAKAREFTEPFIFEAGVDEGFLSSIEDRGFHSTRGRMYHLMGKHDKGKAVRLLKKWYEQEHGKIISIGLGDGFNDLPLLKEVDYPVLIQKRDGSYDSGVSVKGLIMAPGIGPAGWNAAVLALLRK